MSSSFTEPTCLFQNKHSGRKLQWHHHMSNGTITLSNSIGKFDLDVTTFQMAVLFCWENRRHERLTLENLRLATELPDSELRRTLWSLLAMPKLKRQILLVDPPASRASDIIENSQVGTSYKTSMAGSGSLLWTKADSSCRCWYKTQNLDKLILEQNKIQYSR